MNNRTVEAFYQKHKDAIEDISVMDAVTHRLICYSYCRDGYKEIGNMKVLDYFFEDSKHIVVVV